MIMTGRTRKRGRQPGAPARKSSHALKRMPPLLREEFADGAPKRGISADGVRRRMDNRLRRYIVHGASERMSGGAIADDLGVGRSTVYDFLKKLDDASDNFAKYGIVVEIFPERSGRGNEWFCRICGSTWRKRIPAGVHASLHLRDPQAPYEKRLVSRMLAEDEE